MRLTTIISSSVSVVNRVIDVVVAVGSLRTFLHRTLMREFMGLWRELYQQVFANLDRYQHRLFAKYGPAKAGRPGHPGQLIPAPVVCTTPSRLRSNGMLHRG
jgi:hypothetical protein